MSFLLPMWEWFIIYTTHFWWFGRWFIIVLPTLLYSHVYQWRGLVVSFCLLCNDPCWRSHNLSFHLSLLWLSLSLMLDMTRICRSHGKVWRISILGHRFWPHRFFLAPQKKNRTHPIVACHGSGIKVRTCRTSRLDEHHGAPKCSLWMPRGLSLWGWGWHYSPLRMGSAAAFDRDFTNIK